jgi:hypothetical protein
MNQSMKEGLILAIVLGLAVMAAEALTADRRPQDPAVPADSLLTHQSSTTSHPGGGVLQDRR